MAFALDGGSDGWGILGQLGYPGDGGLGLSTDSYLNGVFWVALSHLAFVFFLILLEHGHH